MASHQRARVDVVFTLRRSCFSHNFLGALTRRGRRRLVDDVISRMGESRKLVQAGGTAAIAVAVIPFETARSIAHYFHAIYK